MDPLLLQFISFFSVNKVFKKDKSICDVNFLKREDQSNLLPKESLILISSSVVRRGNH